MDKNVIKSPGFFADIGGELKKVSWPSRAQTIRLTATVFIISLIVAFYLGIIDVLLAKILEVLTKTR